MIRCLRIIAFCALLTASATADMTHTFQVVGRGASGRTYTITSRQLGNVLNWGQRGIYSFAPVHMPDGSYALLFTSCANPGSGCVIGGAGGTYLMTSPDGVNNWSTPTLVLNIANAPQDPVNGGKVIDMTAPRVINYNGTWYVYEQGTSSTTSIKNNSLYVASGPSLSQLSWAPNAIVQINPQHDIPSGAGIGQEHQWFNSVAYGGYPGYTVMGVYNDWNYSSEGQGEFAALSADGTTQQYWYGPVFPAFLQTSPSDYSIMYPDVILSGSLDAGLFGDISISLANGCFAGQRAYLPVVALAFYNAPYIYRNGSYFNTTPIVACSATSSGDQCGNPPPMPTYSNALIETSGPSNSGSEPRFARNQYGYVDPIPGSNPPQWQAYVYYTSSQIGLNSDAQCDYTQYNKVNATIGVSLVTITEN
jgi:hypothetical protein